jgi:Protein of unknown function (DUF2950)
LLTSREDKSLLSSTGHLTGGFVLLAYPANWGVSGVMSFAVMEDGVVLQRDLGEETNKTASTMKTFYSDSTWQKVEDYL